MSTINPDSMQREVVPVVTPMRATVGSIISARKAVEMIRNLNRTGECSFTCHKPCKTHEAKTANYTAEMLNQYSVPVLSSSATRWTPAAVRRLARAHGVGLKD